MLSHSSQAVCPFHQDGANEPESTVSDATHDLAGAQLKDECSFRGKEMLYAATASQIKNFWNFFKAFEAENQSALGTINVDGVFTSHSPAQIKNEMRSKCSWGRKALHLANLTDDGLKAAFKEWLPTVKDSQEFKTYTALIDYSVLPEMSADAAHSHLLRGLHTAGSVMSNLVGIAPEVIKNHNGYPKSELENHPMNLMAVLKSSIYDIPARLSHYSIDKFAEVEFLIWYPMFSVLESTGDPFPHWNPSHFRLTQGRIEIDPAILATENKNHGKCPAVLCTGDSGTNIVMEYARWYLEKVEQYLIGCDY